MKTKKAKLVLPTFSRVLIEVDDKKDVSEGGIIIPETAKDKPKSGTVRAVGGGRVLEDGSLRPCDLAVGEDVLFGPYAGTDIGPHQDGKWLIMDESEVLAVVTK